MRLEDSAIQDVVLVTQLPSESWFEGFAMRPNGRILCARLDKPELYTFEAADAEATPDLVYTFSDATGLINVCSLPGSPDEYIVISGYVDMKKPHFDGFKLWRVALLGSDDFNAVPPTVTHIRDLDNCGFPMCAMPFLSTVLLISDTFESCIRVLDLKTDTMSVLVSDVSMAPASKEDPFGVNRLHVDENYVWFTNSSMGLLGRIAIEAAEGVGVRTVGPIDILERNLNHCDGLAIARDRSAAYTASYMDGLLWKVSMDPETGHTHTSVVGQNLVSPTALELVYSDDGRSRIFIVCCGEIDVGWIHHDEARSWSDLAGINSSVAVEVTTTEETI